MPNVRRLRLHQVARELKVGQTTIVEYLEKKGIKVENAPSTLIEPHVYEVLDKEFGANKAETVNIREKINQKRYPSAIARTALRPRMTPTSRKR